MTEILPLLTLCAASPGHAHNATTGQNYYGAADADRARHDAAVASTTRVLPDPVGLRNSIAPIGRLRLVKSRPLFKKPLSAAIYSKGSLA
jgi:hypothetical protein